jgi:hypothetical protein
MASATAAAANTYKPNGGCLKLPKIPHADYAAYREDIHARIVADGRLKIVPVSELEDKYDGSFDCDVYLETHPDKVAIVGEIFGAHPNKNHNGSCFSMQIGQYQTDFIDLENPEMGAAYYSVSAGLPIGLMLKKSPISLRQTDLCLDINGYKFILSTDATLSYRFLGIDLSRLRKAKTRHDLFLILMHSHIYNPELIKTLAADPKMKADMIRPIMVDFAAFCSSRPASPGQCVEMTIDSPLTFFGKRQEYDAYLRQKEEEARQQLIRTRAKETLTNELKRMGITGKEQGEKMKGFRQWVFDAFGEDYDVWVVSTDMDVCDVFHRYVASTTQQ